MLPPLTKDLRNYPTGLIVQTAYGVRRYALVLNRLGPWTYNIVWLDTNEQDWVYETAIRPSHPLMMLADAAENLR